MSLDSFFEPDPEPTRSIQDIIKQRRAQMLIHSCIYYHLDETIVSDHRWQRWADELEKIQIDNPDKCEIGFFDYEFRNWDGATGNHLPHRHPWVFSKANYILDLHKKIHGDLILP
jgi:hypothetical protein